MMYKKIKRYIIFLLFISIVFSMSDITFANEQNISKKVLFISSYDYDWDSVPKQLDGFTKAIDGNAKIDYVFMDTKTHKYEDVKEQIFNQIKGYIDEDGNYSVVVLGDDAALDFALEYRSELFTDTPMVFEGINTEEKAYSAAADPLITGVVESFPMEETISLAKEMYATATRIVAITDDTESCKGSIKQFYDTKQQFPDLEYEILDCSKLNKSEIEKQVSTYGKDTILLFLMMSDDSEGNYYSQFEASRIISNAASIPVFKADELGIGDGLLGGVVISYETMGNLAGEMATQIINGVSPEDINVKIMPYNTVIDEGVMRKYNIKASGLPSDM